MIKKLVSFTYAKSLSQRKSSTRNNGSVEKTDEKAGAYAEKNIVGREGREEEKGNQTHESDNKNKRKPKEGVKSTEKGKERHKI